MQCLFSFYPLFSEVGLPTQTAPLPQPWGDERSWRKNFIFKDLIQFLVVSPKVWPSTCLPNKWIYGFLRIHKMQAQRWASLGWHLVLKSPTVSTLQAMAWSYMQDFWVSVVWTGQQRITQQQRAKTGPAEMGCTFIYKLGVHVLSCFRPDDFFASVGTLILCF